MQKRLSRYGTPNIQDPFGDNPFGGYLDRTSQQAAYQEQMRPRALPSQTPVNPNQFDGYANRESQLAGFRSMANPDVAPTRAAVPAGQAFMRQVPTANIGPQRSTFGAPAPRPAPMMMPTPMTPREMTPATPREPTPRQDPGPTPVQRLPPPPMDSMAPPMPDMDSMRAPPPYVEPPRTGGRMPDPAGRPQYKKGGAVKAAPVKKKAGGVIAKPKAYQAGGAVKSPVAGARKPNPYAVDAMPINRVPGGRPMPASRKPATSGGGRPMPTTPRYKKGGMVMGDKPEASMSASEERDATGYAGGMGRYERNALKNMSEEAEDRARLIRKGLKRNTAEMERSGGYSKFKKGGVVKKKAGGVVKKAMGGMVRKGCK